MRGVRKNLAPPTLFFGRRKGIGSNVRHKVDRFERFKDGDRSDICSGVGANGEKHQRGGSDIVKYDSVQMRRRLDGVHADKFDVHAPDIYGANRFTDRQSDAEFRRKL